jgi:hypothetical protein
MSRLTSDSTTTATDIYFRASHSVKTFDKGVAVSVNIINQMRPYMSSCYFLNCFHPHVSEPHFFRFTQSDDVEWNSSDMSFQQSLQPMLVWMRFIGVFLESPGTSPEAASPWIRIGITCYGFLFFFGNVFFNGLHITEFFALIEITSSYSSTASLWTVAISTLNLAAMTICCQLSLVSSAATKWPNLMQMLCQMESQGCFESRDYQNFRRIFLGGLTSIMVTLSFLKFVSEFVDVKLLIYCPGICCYHFRCDGCSSVDT